MMRSRLYAKAPSGRSTPRGSVSGDGGGVTVTAARTAAVGDRETRPPAATTGNWTAAVRAAVLFAWFRSIDPELRKAVCVKEPATRGVTVSVAVALPPGSSAPRSNWTWLPDCAKSGLAETKVKSVDNVTVTTTRFARPGPLLLTVMVEVRFPPT